MEKNSEFTYEINPAGLVQDRWDDRLTGADDATIFQSWQWGEYKRNHGWQPLRCTVYDTSGRTVMMAQVLLKSLPFGIRAGWAAGGPVLKFKGWSPKQAGKALNTLRAGLLESQRRLWLRVHSHSPNEPELAYLFSGQFHRPFFKVNSGFSQFIDLTQSVEAFEKGMTAKHRYYVRQAQGQGLTWKLGGDDELRRDFAMLHEEMTREKGMESIRVGLDETRKIFSALGSQALILNGYHAGVPVTSCLVQRFGNRGFYASAATGAKGRELSAAYAMVHELFRVLKERGMTRLDFAGLDPKTSAASGVNHFKRGFGAQLVEYLGEWECASSEKLRWAINFALWKRGGRL
ncbi:MAG: peptidoglycan bridge formation glycyltransferase FemA/FemB family protein [Betaproteobacteria bacterium]|nr:peptidoglycan bridge formation glycyltransferase FemA/FemB family protein [Betaproteobacteria bacterium]